MSEANKLHRRANRRALQPLAWWLLLVLALFLIRTHQRLSERTRLRFEPVMNRETVGFEASARLDGKPFSNGERVSIGSHTLSITHPKTKPFTTNLFIWYGERNLQAIHLQRAKGTLAVAASPAAKLISISGPEYSVVLTNVSGWTSSVPTDRYVIEARFKHLNQNTTVDVVAGSSAAREFTPRVGVVNILCNQTDAAFDLFTSDDSLLERGTVPAALSEIPAGTCRLITRHHDKRLERKFAVSPGVTNDVRIDFRYGGLLLETDPAGATVYRDDERLGQTPLTISESFPGKWRFRFERNGYEGIEAELEITANATNHFQTNFVSRRYSEALKQARDYFAAKDYNDAFDAAKLALEHKPRDATALALLKESAGFNQFEQARALAKEGNLGGAIIFLTGAIQALPDNVEAKNMLVDLQLKERQQKEKERQERLGIPKQALATTLRGFTFKGEGDLFPATELKTAKPVAEVEAALRTAFQNGTYKFEVQPKKLPWPDCFALRCKQELSNGLRSCVIVGAQTETNETRIIYEVMEYKKERSVGFDGGLSVNTSFVPLHESTVKELTETMKAQIAEGKRIVEERIQAVVGQK